jgi:hypothetical protein
MGVPRLLSAWPEKAIWTLLKGVAPRLVLALSINPSPFRSGISGSAFHPLDFSSGV